MSFYRWQSRLIKTYFDTYDRDRDDLRVVVCICSLVSPRWLFDSILYGLETEKNMWRSYFFMAWFMPFGNRGLSGTIHVVYKVRSRYIVQRLFNRKPVRFMINYTNYFIRLYIPYALYHFDKIVLLKCKVVFINFTSILLPWKMFHQSDQ